MTSAPARASNALLSVNFNQDHSCIAVGTRDGYSITNCEPFGRVYTNQSGATSLVEMLFCTSLVALVATSDADAKSNASPRRLQIVNTKRQSVICELLFPTAILGVKLNRRRLVVVLENEIYIYDISNMKLLHTIETSPNPNAICALSPSSENCFLAYPSPVPSPTSPFAAGAGAAAGGAGAATAGAAGGGAGDVLIFDLLSLSVTNVIQAHKTPISALALNATGTLLATASDKGTVIRVFSVPAAHKLHQFRRGSYAARIYSINFNAVSSLLAVSSDTETVHIFKLASSSGGSKASVMVSDAASDTSSPPGSANGGRVGGYEAMMARPKQGGDRRQFAAPKHGARQGHHGQRRRLPAQQPDRDVGAGARLCLSQTAYAGREQRGGAQRDHTARHGRHQRGLLLPVQHRPRTRRRVHPPET